MDGEIGLSVEDGKKIMAALQTAIVSSQKADTYTLFRRICPDCGTLRPVKDYTTRLGSMMPYRQAAGVMGEFLPIEPTETHATVRKRTIRAGERLDRQAAEEERSASSQVKDRRQLELELPGDRQREFVVSVDTAHVRSADPKSARNFELVVARCGRTLRSLFLRQSERCFDRGSVPHLPRTRGARDGVEVVCVKFCKWRSWCGWGYAAFRSWVFLCSLKSFMLR